MSYKSFCDKCNKETIHKINMFCRPGIINLEDKLSYCTECRDKRRKEQELDDMLYSCCEDLIDGMRKHIRDYQQQMVNSIDSYISSEVDKFNKETGMNITVKAKYNYSYSCGTLESMNIEIEPEEKTVQIMTEYSFIQDMLNNINNNNFNKEYFDFDIDKLDKAMAQTPTTMPVINTIEELDEWLNRGELSESIEQLTPEQCKALLINNVDNWSDVMYGFYDELKKGINNTLNK